ncbi:hypothetical protein GCM10027037_08180 [Mucilaginibacter koreensis]
MPQQKDIQLTGRLAWVQRIAHLFDSAFRVPGTNFRFGLDPILNFIPVAGDVSGFVVGAALVWVMAKQGVSRKVLILMVMNITIDAILGAIPIIGWVTDFYYKANNRNLKLLQEHYVEGRHSGKGTGLLIVLLLIVACIFGLCLYLIYALVHWVWVHI